MIVAQEFICCLLKPFSSSTMFALLLSPRTRTTTPCTSSSSPFPESVIQHSEQPTLRRSTATTEWRLDAITTSYISSVDSSVDSSVYSSVSTRRARMLYQSKSESVESRQPRLRGDARADGQSQCFPGQDKCKCRQRDFPHTHREQLQ